MNQTIALTGATGFIGRSLTRQLLDDGRSVVALVRETSDRTVLPDHQSLAFLDYEDLDSTDLADELRTHAPSVFVHAGWAGVSGDARRQVDQVGINVTATRSSVELASAAGCRRWIGVGSQEEFGPTDAVLDESTPLNPDSSYGRAKVKAAKAARDAGALFGLPIVWARLFSVYGPGDHYSSVVSSTIRALRADVAPNLGACEHDVDLLYVDDAAAALVALVDSSLTGDINVAAGEHQPLRATLELLADQLGKRSVLHFAEPTTKEPSPRRASSTRLQSLTGWSPTTSLVDGMAATIAAT